MDKAKKIVVTSLYSHWLPATDHRLDTECLCSDYSELQSITNDDYLFTTSAGPSLSVMPRMFSPNCPQDDNERLVGRKTIERREKCKTVGYEEAISY